MEHLDSEQVYRILQNLSNLEISYLEYSNMPKNFVEYKTYIDYFNNYGPQGWEQTWLTVW